MKGWMLLAGTIVTQQGCSIYAAATAPLPVEVEKVKVGSSRAEAIAVFGTPKQTDVREGIRTDVFEFVDGNTAESKARIILYIAGDIFTLGLSELIFWPMELALLKGTEGRAVVRYASGDDDVVRSVRVTKRDGTPWNEKRANPPTPGRARDSASLRD